MDRECCIIQPQLFHSLGKADEPELENQTLSSSGKEAAPWRPNHIPLRLTGQGTVALCLQGAWGLCCCSVTKPHPTLCDPMDCSMPGFPVLYHLPEFAQIHVHCIRGAIQPSHPLPPLSPPALNLSRHQGLFQ